MLPPLMSSIAEGQNNWRTLGGYPRFPLSQALLQLSKGERTGAFRLPLLEKHRGFIQVVRNPNRFSYIRIFRNTFFSFLK